MMTRTQTTNRADHLNPAYERSPSWWSWWHGVELGATFLLFAGVMHFMYLAPPGTPFEDIGAPGHDSFYHIKMAVLMPQIGLIDKFPWLRTTIFNDRFINHNYGFQLLLSPFVYLSHWLTGDYAAGGRWFMTLSFGVSMVLFQLLLMVRRIERRWIWLGLCLLLPSQFYSRHLFVRAIDPSFICMLLLCLCMFTRSYLAAGVVTCLSIHVYLGAVIYAPVLVGAVLVAGLTGLVGDLLREQASFACLRRELVRFDGWRLAMWTLAGWLVGMVTHPYGGLEALRFLEVQVFGTGLTPKIPVGREWKSYSPAWFFANMSGITLCATGIAVCLRLRFGGRLRTDELSLLLINMVFLTLTLKARRFIEYWPAFSILSSAYLAGPILGPPQRPPWDNGKQRGSARFATAGVAATCLLVVAMCATGAWMAAKSVPHNYTAEWRLWTLLTGFYVLVPIARTCTAGQTATASFAERAIGAGHMIVCGTVFCTAVAGILWLLGGSKVPQPERIHLGWQLFALLGVAYGICGVVAVKRIGAGHHPFNVKQPDASDLVSTSERRPESTWRLRAIRSAVAVTSAIAVVSIVMVPAGALIGRLQRNTRCDYDLPAIRRVMQVLQTESQENAVVFTDDWDVFPVFFYLNHRNHYVVGLDPEFSHKKDPVLWERYVRISRGQTPTSRRIQRVVNGQVVYKKIVIRLSDIRDFFHADFVIVDRDHMALAKNLDRAPALAERILPPRTVHKATPPYLLYRILPALGAGGGGH